MIRQPTTQLTRKGDPSQTCPVPATEAKAKRVFAIKGRKTPHASRRCARATNKRARKRHGNSTAKSGATTSAGPRASATAATPLHGERPSSPRDASGGGPRPLPAATTADLGLSEDGGGAGAPEKSAFLFKNKRCTAGVKCARRSCARRACRHLNCTRRLPKLRTPYRSLHTCSIHRVQYGVHNSRILTTPETTAQPSLPLHGEPACPPPSSVGRGRLPPRQF